MIAKKHVRLSVARNKIKRIIRESFRRHQEMLPGLDIVVVAERELVKLDNDGLHQCLQTYWQKLAARYKKG